MTTQCIVSERGASRSWDMDKDRPTTFRIFSHEAAMAVFEETVPVGSGTSLHIHHGADELVHVHSGTVRFHVNGATREVGAGAWVFIPRGAVHGWRVTGDVPAETSFVFSPGSGARCFEEARLFNLPLMEIPPDQLDALFKGAGFEIVAFEWD